MKTIVKTLYGSKLYGTDTEDSDTDIKGIYMPTKRQIYLNNIPEFIHTSTSNKESKNTKNDVDVEFYSLHHFFKLACKGDTSAIDILHAPESAIIQSSYTWERLVSERHMFYTKDLTALVKYARTQATKNSVKSERLNDLQQVIKVLEENIKNIKKPKI